MNMTRKRSPRKKRLEHGCHLTFEWWTVILALITTIPSRSNIEAVEITSTFVNITQNSTRSNEQSTTYKRYPETQTIYNSTLNVYKEMSNEENIDKIQQKINNRTITEEISKNIKDSKDVKETESHEISRTDNSKDLEMKEFYKVPQSLKTNFSSHRLKYDVIKNNDSTKYSRENSNSSFKSLCSSDYMGQCQHEGKLTAESKVIGSDIEPQNSSEGKLDYKYIDSKENAVVNSELNLESFAIHHIGSELNSTSSGHAKKELRNRRIVLKNTLHNNLDDTLKLKVNDSANEESRIMTEGYIKTNIINNNTTKDNSQISYLNSRKDLERNVTNNSDDLRKEINEQAEIIRNRNLMNSKKSGRSNSALLSSGSNNLVGMNRYRSSESDRKSSGLSESGEVKNGVKNITSLYDVNFEIDGNQMTTEAYYESSYEIDDDDDDTLKGKTTAAPPSAAMEALGAIRMFAQGVLESVAERVIPQGLRDLLRRVQDQNSALETVRLRSKEENGGLGIFGRSILKSIADPITQLMQGVRDYGSLDSDKNFFAGVASGVASVADSVAESFKDRVKAIYPGTLWCGDGDVARSAEVGLFFMTDSCCRRHDECRQYILAGGTKYGLTNTGLFTRSHCDCDRIFYRCLKRTNSLISMQVGVTYFSILGPQCFKRDYPIVRCLRRTRLTGQKCEEYELDTTQPKVWQWFDNETF